MGAEASKPKPGARLQVSRATGTASFSAALEILLNGPVYYGGTQTLVKTDDRDVKAWTDVLARTPYKSAADREDVMGRIKALTEGFVATTDSPGAQFVEELMELYPDAKVICTVRDPDAWAASMDQTSSTSLQTLLALIVFWVPVIRHFPHYIQHMQAGRWGELYSVPGEKWSYGRDVWERHIAYLGRTVPKERLVYFDVSEGWEPLCKLLGVEMPVKVEFPRINDGRAIDEFTKKQVQRGLMRWGGVVGVWCVVGWMGWKWFGR